MVAGILSAVSFGFHQVGIFAVWFFMLVRMFRHRYSINNILIDKNTWLGLITAFTGIIIMQFLRIKAPTVEWFEVHKPYSNIYEKFLNLFLYNNLLYNLKQIFITEPVTLILVLISLFSKRSWTKMYLPITLFIISTFLVIGISFIQPRYLLPVILLMCIYTANSLSRILIPLNYKALRRLLIMLLLFLSSVYLIKWNLIYLPKPTFILAADWIENNTKPQDVIITTASRFMPFAPSTDVINLQQNRHPRFYEAVEKTLKKGQYPQNVRNIIYLGEVGDIHNKQNVPSLLENLPVTYKYIIDIYFDPGDSPLISVDKSPWKKRTSYSPFTHNSVRISFDNILTTIDKPILPVLLMMLERAGPYVDIYQVKT